MSELRNEIELVGNKIAFEFLEEYEKGGFSNKSRGGIYFRESQENQLEKARWARVLLTGPEVSEVEEGEYVLVEPLRWTTSLEVGDYEGRFWMTDETGIMAVSDEVPDI